MFVATQPIALTEEERTELGSRARARSLRSSDTQRARIILQLADGASFRGAAVAAGCSQMTVNVWKQRFVEERLEGLYGRHRGTRTTAATAGHVPRPPRRSWRPRSLR